MGGTIEKFKLVSYVYGKQGHKSYQCNQRKGRPDKKPTPQANFAEQDDVIATVVVEANMVENKFDWILDTGASRLFCSNRDLFHEFEDSTNGECVGIGISATTRVLGKGKILLKLAFGKTLSLSNVLFVPSLCQNLASRNLLNQSWFKIVFEADKVKIVGKGYLVDVLFVLNTILVSNLINASASNSAYIVESIDVWHGRLGHVNVGPSIKSDQCICNA